MQRLVALIAVIFAFAAVAGTTTAHAHRYVSTPLVVLNLVDADNVSIPVMVSVQKGEIDLGSGIVMPCGSHHAIPVAQEPSPATRTHAIPEPHHLSVAPQWSSIRLLRPPRLA